MLIFVYDTETTGLVRGTDYTDPNMPFLASIAGVLYDDKSQRIAASINAMVQPDGWVMPEDASRVNGLTNEILQQLGISAPVLLPACIALMSRANLRVAHNVDFDSKVIAAALWRHTIKEYSEEAAHKIVKAWLALPSYCTMQESKDIVKALNKQGKIKYPKLTEAYKFFFDKELDRAHSANADAIAALEIYLALNRQGGVK